MIRLAGCLGLVIGASLLQGPGVGQAAESGSATPAPIQISPEESWKEAQQAIRKFRVAPGFKVELVAADPQLANVVAFGFDAQGRIYTSETGRYRSSALDIRQHMSWYLDDLKSRTVEDRVEVVRKHMGSDWRKMEVESERVRLLEDLNGDGRVDRSRLFAGGFTNVLDGIASGVMAWRGDVYFASIPDLWRLRDTDGDGQADQRESMSHGYGVHFGLTGHDLHGLTVGGDGRIYFTVGDRGVHLTTRERRLIDYPDEGVCFRMDPDGSNLEVFATGLRNPQELAFDDLGNLFTGENDCDHGDRERWMHLLEGADYGWRMGFQFSEQNPGGVWMAERWWWTNFVGRTAFAFPPMAHIENGPSGIAHYPGTGLPESYRGAFLVTHFKGVDSVSGIRSLKMRPKGAGFELASDEELIWNTLPTDVDFSPDGLIHFSDWVHGWPKSERGRLYRLVPDQRDPRASETARLLAEGMRSRAVVALGELLAHADRRIRLEAQFELAGRVLSGGRDGGSALRALRDAALIGRERFGRIHGLWGLGQLAAKGHRGFPAREVLRVLADEDEELRIQAIRVLSEGRGSDEAVRAALAARLADGSARVRAAAAMALGKRAPVGQSGVVEPVLDMLRAGDPRDPYLRHAAVMALTWNSNRTEVIRHSDDPSGAVRMACVLALRRWRDAGLTNFLRDVDPLIVTETARAIHDAPVPELMPALAALLPDLPGRFTDDWPEDVVLRPLFRRVLSAAHRAGLASHASALAAVVVRAAAPAAYRAEALALLAEWERPGPRDKILGLWRPIPSREAGSALSAVRPILDRSIASGPEEVRVAAARAAAALGIGGAAKALAAAVTDAGAPVAVRVEALRALARLDGPEFKASIQVAAGASEVALRKEATRLSAMSNPGQAAPELAKVLANGSIPEKQTALAALATIPGTVADEIIYGQLRPWVEGEGLAPELQLDVLEASEARADERIKAYLEQYRAKLPKDNPVAAMQVALHGGNAEAGRKVFYERAEAQCVRCHRIRGEGGDVGPDLGGIGSRQTREYLLESLMQPNATVAPGFETVLLSTKSGQGYAGVVKSETDTEIVINSPEDGPVTVRKSDIESRTKGLSGMPDGLGLILTRSDIRDLIEFLASLK